MPYAENYNLTKVYWKKYIDMYFDVYQSVYDRMSKLYENEEACAAAVATVMIAFSKASGMDMAGIVTWDEKDAGEAEDFKTFAEPKQRSEGGYPQKSWGNKPTGGYQKPGGYQQKPGGYQKRAYNGPSPDELTGPASAKQINKINELMNDQDQDVVEAVTTELGKLDIGDPEDLKDPNKGKSQAHHIIQAGIDVRTKKGKKY